MAFARLATTPRQEFRETHFEVRNSDMLANSLTESDNLINFYKTGVYAPIFDPIILEQTLTVTPELYYRIIWARFIFDNSSYTDATKADFTIVIDTYLLGKLVQSIEVENDSSAVITCTGTQGNDLRFDDIIVYPANGSITSNSTLSIYSRGLAIEGGLFVNRTFYTTCLSLPYIMPMSIDTIKVSFGRKMRGVNEPPATNTQKLGGVILACFSSAQPLSGR